MLEYCAVLWNTELQLLLAHLQGQSAHYLPKKPFSLEGNSDSKSILFPVESLLVPSFTPLKLSVNVNTIYVLVLYST